MGFRAPGALHLARARATLRPTSRRFAADTRSQGTSNRRFGARTATCSRGMVRGHDVDVIARKKERSPIHLQEELRPWSGTRGARLTKSPGAPTEVVTGVGLPSTAPHGRRACTSERPDGKNLPQNRISPRRRWIRRRHQRAALGEGCSLQLHARWRP